MATLYAVQDVFTRGEVSPRLHARASLDLYRAALSKCENFVTLPHGGIRARGGTLFVGEVKRSARKTRAIPFIFSSEQAYCLEFGDLYIRVYAYDARVGTVEIGSPYLEADLFDLAYVQSADQMWITRRNYPPKVLTRTAHTVWTLQDFEFLDGPYDGINDTATTLTPLDAKDDQQHRAEWLGLDRRRLDGCLEDVRPRQDAQHPDLQRRRRLALWPHRGLAVTVGRPCRSPLSLARPVSAKGVRLAGWWRGRNVACAGALRTADGRARAHVVMRSGRAAVSIRSAPSRTLENLAAAAAALALARFGK